VHPLTRAPSVDNGGSDAYLEHDLAQEAKSLLDNWSGRLQVEQTRGGQVVAKPLADKACGGHAAAEA
jgi:hypothetical protein